MRVLRSVFACAAVLGLLAGAPPARGQGDDFSKVEFKTTRLADGVYMLAGAGGNIGVSAGPDGVFLIDDEFAPLVPKLKAALAAISDRPLRFLLNTHWHGDHTGGNKDLGEAGVLIVAHDNVRVRMSSEQFLAAFNRHVPAAPDKALPVVTFESTVTFHMNGEEIRATHLPPAHTDGDAVIYFQKADVLHTGDLFFNGLYPFIDVDSGGSLEGMIADAERMLGLLTDKTRIIPGHGPVGDRAALQAFHDMLVGVRDQALPLVRAGKSEAEVLAAKPTRDFDAKWGQGFLKPDDFAKIVYASLSKTARTGAK